MRNVIDCIAPGTYEVSCLKAVNGTPLDPADVERHGGRTVVSVQAGDALEFEQTRDFFIKPLDRG